MCSFMQDAVKQTALKHLYFIKSYSSKTREGWVKVHLQPGALSHQCSEIHYRGNAVDSCPGDANYRNITARVLLPIQC